tara:strand:- start:4845 stop:5132 length:288 start_codon:yes stop_codon:yes gene_type:complete
MKMSEEFDLPVNHTGKVFDDYGRSYQELNDNNGDEIFGEGRSVSFEEARYIAHAINNHDELVEALEELLFLCEGEKNPPTEVIRARAVLAKSKGE